MISRGLGIALTVGCLAACGGPAAPPSTPASGGITENLTLTGPVSGTLTAATSAVCTTGGPSAKAANPTGTDPGTTPYTAVITGPVTSGSAEITIRVDLYFGGGEYVAQKIGNLVTGASAVALPARPADQASEITASGGTITVDATARSGKLDITAGTQHITGTWTCG